MEAEKEQEEEEDHHQQEALRHGVAVCWRILPGTIIAGSRCVRTAALQQIFVELSAANPEITTA
eukprot:3186050-Pyramimonas_sp.AAC.1